jgi:hypothetical protein
MSITVGSSTITLNSGAVIQAPSGTPPYMMPRAWINFSSYSVNGSSSGGGLEIYGSSGISSITNGTATGEININFTNNMPDSLYVLGLQGATINGYGAYQAIQVIESLTQVGGTPVRKGGITSVPILPLSGSYGLAWGGSINVSIFR